MLFFTREIFPIVRSHLQEIKFYIIGDKAPPEVVSLADEDIIVTGYQADVSSYFNRIRLSVAPLRYGAGVKGKVNQSMGLGVPVVATSIAVEGMDLQDRVHALVADDPESFANAIIELYQSEELWRNISQKGLEKIKQSYSVQAARRELQRLLGDRPPTEPAGSDNFKSANSTPVLQER